MTGGIGSEVSIQPYSRRFLQGILDLLYRTDHAVTEEHFIWEFEDNPVGSVNIHVAVSGEEVIGIACHNSFKILIGGAEEIVSFPLQVVTDPRYRGRGIFSTLESSCEEEAARRGCNLMLSFPNDVSTPIFLERLGWSRIRAPRYVAQIVKPDRLVSESLTNKPVFRAAGTAIGATIGLLERMHREPQTTMVREDRFDEWSDELWIRIRGTLDRSVVRTSDYLNWRFVDNPSSRYEIWKLVDRGGTDSGYFVVGETAKKGRSIHFVASSLLLPDCADRHEQLRRALGRRSTAAIRLDLVQPIPGNAIKQVSWGYMPVPKRLHFIGKPLTPLGTSYLQHPLRWNFQLGDLDFF